MPRIDELPMPAQNQIRAQHAPALPPPSRPRRRSQRVSLLQRLASVGLGRREDEVHEQRQAPRSGSGRGRADGSADAEGTPDAAAAACARAARAGRHVGIRQASGRASGPRRRVSTSTAVRLRCRPRWTTTNSKSRPSCAVRRTDGRPTGQSRESAGGPKGRPLPFRREAVKIWAASRAKAGTGAVKQRLTG